jgi:arylformamidase
MSPILDISPLISPALAVWPGSRPFRRTVSVHPAPGGDVETGDMEATLHLGAHADAPSHYLAGGPALDQVDLVPYWGPCQVVRVAVEPRGRVLPRHLPGPILAPRVLFRTDSYPDPRRFTEDFAGLSPELIQVLHAQGCLLVGIDTPSVDPFASEALETHRALGAHGMRVLEGLCLGQVEEGLYTLSALPLRIQDGDGSPVRAALRTLKALS